MSKHNHYTNYRNMAKPVEEAIPAETKDDILEATQGEVKTEFTEVSAEDTIDVEELLNGNVTVENEDDATEAPAEETIPETLVGKVSECKKLNIRKEPSIESEPVSVVDAGAVLMIDTAKSTEEWFNVFTEAGVEGFCMKKFVTVM